MDASPHPLQVMVADFDTAETSPKNRPNELEVEKPEAPSNIQITEQKRVRTTSIGLAGIKYPAILLNRDLEIAWQNSGAVEHIWQGIGAANNGNPTPGVLDLIFDAAFMRQVTNYPQCLDFFLNQLIGLLPAHELGDRVSEMPVERRKLLLPLLERTPEQNTKSGLYGGYLTMKLRSGRQTTFKIMALSYDEGRLLIFDPQPNDKPDQRLTATQNVTNRFERIRQQPNPVLTPYFLLSAEINQASILRTELLAEDHWRLINSICRGCLDRIENFGGVFGQHVGHGFHAYFLPDQTSDVDAMHVIQCALELKAEAVELGRKWRISKDWIHDIDLNIGIHYEEAYVGMLPVLSGDSLTSFGEGLRVAGAISQWAEDGQIWATKPVISRIPPAKNKSMRFGILKTNQEHRKVFMQNAFASIGSVFGLQTSGKSFEDELSYLPVTQIFDLSGRDG